MMSKCLSLRIFGLLVWRDILIFIRGFKNNLINALIWVISSVGVNAWLLPKFGLDSSFGTLVLASTVASQGFFCVMRNTGVFVADLYGQNQISYDLTLPISHRMVFVQRGLVLSIRTIFLAIIVLPIGKIFFWSKIDLSGFVLWKFLLIFLISSLMYGFIGLWFVSFVKDARKMVNVWTRIFFPMWFWGGFQFSWISMNHVLKSLSYIALGNPILYVMEGFHSAIIGPSGFINFWICLMATSIFAVVFYFRGVGLLMKRLDCI